MQSLNQIHQLEISESYPAAVDALEQRLAQNSEEEETVIRLAFNYWLMAEKASMVQSTLATEGYAKRFMDLYKKYESQFSKSADFMFAFGLGLSLYWYLFPGATEQLGKNLLKRAAQLDPFFKGFLDQPRWIPWKRKRPNQEELKKKFSGRGVLAKYYGVV